MIHTIHTQMNGKVVSWSSLRVYKTANTWWCADALNGSWFPCREQAFRSDETPHRRVSQALTLRFPDGSQGKIRGGLPRRQRPSSIEKVGTLETMGRHHPTDLENMFDIFLGDPMIWTRQVRWLFTNKKRCHPSPDASPTLWGQYAFMASRALGHCVYHIAWHKQTPNSWKRLRCLQQTHQNTGGCSKEVTLDPQILNFGSENRLPQSPMLIIASPIKIHQFWGVFISMGPKVHQVRKHLEVPWPVDPFIISMRHPLVRHTGIQNRLCEVPLS